MNLNNIELKIEHQKRKRKKLIIIFVLLLLTFIMTFVCLFVGSSHLSLAECFKALFGLSSDANNRIMQNIRLPRVLAALIAGAGLSVSGLIMQTVLNNPMASPSTLGVSNAAVFGANVAIIAFSGGFINVGNVSAYGSTANPFATSTFAFIFSILSVLVILALCKIQQFSPNAVVLAGIAIGAIWTAGTTLLQYYATDVGLSAAVIWSFGDLGRATFTQDYIMLAVVLIGFIFFFVCAWKYNALLSGDNTAKSMGINVDLLRFISLLLSSIITAVCVSYLGIIGFVGIICPHVMKRILGQDHRYLIPASLIAGSLLLLIADTISRTAGNGSSIPVGAITSILGAPFFLFIIFARKENSRC